MYPKKPSVHPGSAKNVMINAATAAMAFHAMLPEDEVPEKTDGYEGFFHLTEMSGSVTETTLRYIIRDHDRERFEEKKALFADCAARINEIYGDGTAEEYGALNEILVCRGAVSKMIRLALRCNGTDVAAYRADGLIVSTPTGSTAYALSAGGPIIDPALSLISVCPICPHTFAGARPLVFSPDSGLEITVSSLYNGDIYLTADGKASRSVNYDDVITVTGSERSVRFIKLKSNAFYQTLYKKFKAGV